MRIGREVLGIAARFRLVVLGLWFRARLGRRLALAQFLTITLTATMNINRKRAHGVCTTPTSLSAIVLPLLCSPPQIASFLHLSCLQLLQAPAESS